MNGIHYIDIERQRLERENEALRNALRKQELREENERLRRQLGEVGGGGGPRRIGWPGQHPRRWETWCWVAS